MTHDDDGDGVPRTRQSKRIHWHPPVDLSEIDLSDEETISMEEVERMIRHPGWRLRLRRLVNAPRWRLQQAWHASRPRWQRATRGWADEDWWTLDAHLCLHLGTLLKEQARHAHSFPAEMTFEEWTAEFDAAGEALLAFDPDDARRVGAAQDALRWVADNLTRLWD